MKWHSNNDKRELTYPKDMFTVSCIQHLQFVFDKHGKPAKKNVQKWYKHFQDDRQDANDEPRSGHPRTSTTDEHDSCHDNFSDELVTNGGSLDISSKSNVKDLLTIVFDFRNVMHQDFLSQIRQINKEYYHEIMRHLREAIRRKRPEKPFMAFTSR